MLPGVVRLSNVIEKNSCIKKKIVSFSQVVPQILGSTISSPLSINIDFILCSFTISNVCPCQWDPLQSLKVQRLCLLNALCKAPKIAIHKHDSYNKYLKILFRYLRNVE